MPRICIDSEARHRIREMNAAGKSDYAIADVIGVERSTVQSWRKRMGLPAVVPQPRTPSRAHSKAVDMRTGYVEQWQPRQTRQTSQRVTFYDLRHARPSGRYGCRAGDGTWWDGNLRETGAPYTSPYADYALTRPTRAEAEAVIAEAGFAGVLMVEEVGL